MIELTIMNDKLDLHVGSIYLKDQFEWPLFGSQYVTPEDFARQFVQDLGLGGEFVPAISHTIREQVITSRLNFHAAEQPLQWRSRPFRNNDFDDEWEPELRMLDDEEIDRIAKEDDRNSRRLRRQQRFPARRGATHGNSSYFSGGL